MLIRLAPGMGPEQIAAQVADAIIILDPDGDAVRGLPEWPDAVRAYREAIWETPPDWDKKRLDRRLQRAHGLLMLPMILPPGETARRVRAALEREPELRRQALELGRMFPPGTRIKAFGRMCTAGSF
ncbi:MAG: hypothetical protein NW241_10955, partial [Bacteroidia bacterium]|nr:hypothetical protein [Bacteroidia bacterium]